MTPNTNNSIFTKYLRKLRHSENKVDHVKPHKDIAKNEKTEFDRFRREEYSRIDESGTVYLDYAGAALYPRSLLIKHYEFLEKHILGNPHSASSASMLSSQVELQARQGVLDYFDADSDQYMVVFTSNASAGLKLVAEAYPFGPDKALILSEDSHNSLHGMRKYASQATAQTIYYEVHDTGLKVTNATESGGHLAPSGERGLVVFTAQSNVTGIKQDLGLVEKARLAGFDTIVDIAALATTSRVSINSIKADAAVVSFYKLFGYPTGLGALIMKQKFAQKLRRPYFGGGTIETVQVPGNNVTMTEGPSRSTYKIFTSQDGTTNFLALPAVIYGLRFMDEHIDKLEVRVRTLIDFTRQALSIIRYKNGIRLVTIHGTDDAARRGGTLALTFHKSNGDDVACEKIEVLANNEKISLRSGCLCNPAMTAILLKRRNDIQTIGEHLTFSDLLEKMGVDSLGIVRISFGIASNHEDAKKFLSFAKRLATGLELD
ncbi:hypothetical protein INT43_005283 [Umbelopsis isabellina]|uniref:Aminotransferase class V domain-containing protein n=1 Tax=Mortierella isabellina TaxID=91625 RepID=A0A8H7PHC7_MORIS|nr:hypothetical protein INT43_005283 [Umbelopsis isabellina]